MEHSPLSGGLYKNRKEINMSVACIQDIYRCDTCKSASDEYGRGCKHGMLFPLLLLMRNCNQCPNYELDVEKIEIHLKKRILHEK